MTRYKRIRSLFLAGALFAFFILKPSFSQEGARNPLKNEPTGKTFATVKEIWATPFKSQGETGTCWCFGATSFLESEAHRLGRGDFEISQMYIVYNAYLEKAQRYIRSHGENPFRQGGLSHDVIYLMDKYGALPRSSYIGNKDAENKYDHREMYKALSGMLRGVSEAGQEACLGGQLVEGQFRWHWFPGFKGLLDAYMGAPPESIMHDGKNVTPQQFASDVLNLPLHDYLEITSYSHLPFYSADDLLLPDNWLHFDKFYNVPLDDFMRIIDYSLENGFSICGDLHIKSSEFVTKKNYLLGFDEEKTAPLDQKERDVLFDNWRTEDVHLEHIIGTARDEKGNIFYKAKDSVGSDNGKSGAVYNKEYLSENYVKSRVLFIMIHKDGLPPDISEKLGISKE